jgi:hypothetical protein
MAQLFTQNGNYSTIPLSYPAGLDAGNEDTCFATVDHDGRERIVTIPSAVAEIATNKMDLLREGIHGKNGATDQYHQDIDIQYLGKRYSVGYMTYRHNKQAGTQRGDESRYSSVEQIVRLLSASGLAVEEAEYEIDLVTTVPLKYFSNKLRLDVRNAFEGEHAFTLGGSSRKATIHVKKVMIEGASALALCGAASVGKRRLIIDGGRHTTELIMFQGNEPITAQCNGVEIGVQFIADYITDKIKELYNRDLTVQEISDIIRAYGSRNSAKKEPYPEIFYGVNQLTAQDLYSLTRTGAGLLADKILKEAGSLWGTNNNFIAGDVGHQFFMGGMPFFVAEEIQRKMPRLAMIPDPEQANARGCAQIARALTMKRA